METVKYIPPYKRHSQSRISSKSYLHQHPHQQPHPHPHLHPSFHIKSSQRYLTTKSKDATILNLDEYFSFQEKLKNKFNQKEYDEFKTFNDEVVKKLSKEVDDNTGEIIQCHLFKPELQSKENKDKIMEMYEQYKDTYSVDATKDTRTPTHTPPFKTTPPHKTIKTTTIEGHTYPLFKEDLYSKNALPYENFEIKYGITKKIEEQTDEEFLDTLGKRIDGLNVCKTDPNYNEEFKKYFTNEYEKEKTNFDKIIKKKKKRFFIKKTI